MTDSYLLKDLLEFTRDGEWGKGEPDDDHVEMAVIRGTDFSSVRHGDMSGVPRRYIPKRAAYRKALMPGDILIETAGGTKDQPTGRTVYLSNQIFDEIDVPVTCASFSRFLRVSRERINPRYLFWYLQSIYNTGKILPYHVQHTGVARFQYTNFAAQCYVPVPHLSEQAKIADTLSGYDEKIKINRRMNETLEAMARAIFRDWFVDFGPVRAKMEGREPYLSREIWNMFPERLDDQGNPDGWYASSVGDEFALTMGQAPPGSSYNSDNIGVPFFQGRTDFGARYPSIRMSCTQPTRLAYRGDTLVSVRAPVGEINMAPEECCIGRGLAAVRHRLGGRAYTYQAVKQIQQKIRAFEDTGTVFGSINKRQFRYLRVMRPTDDLVSEFEKMCEPLDERIRQNVIENEKLRQLRDTLLPRLISGEVQIKDAEIGAGEAA